MGRPVRAPQARRRQPTAALPRLSEVVAMLGGPPLRRGRCPAWYRDGVNPSALAIDDDRGIWYDHARKTGGGVLDLIAEAKGTDKETARRWLAERLGGSQCRAPRRTQQDARRREQARAAALSLAVWVEGLKRFLRDIIWTIRREARTLDAWATEQGSIGVGWVWEEVARVPDRLRLADALELYADALTTTRPRDVADMHRRAREMGIDPAALPEPTGPALLKLRGRLEGRA